MKKNCDLCPRFDFFFASINEGSYLSQSNITLDDIYISQEVSDAWKGAFIEYFERTSFYEAKKRNIVLEDLIISDEQIKINPHTKECHLFVIVEKIGYFGMIIPHGYWDWSYGKNNN